MSDSQAEVSFQVQRETVEFALEIEKQGLEDLLPLFQDYIYLFKYIDAEEPVERSDLISHLSDETSIPKAHLGNLLDNLLDAGWLDAVEGQQTGFVLGEKLEMEPKAGGTSIEF
jgi:hypothetical protein